jgi:acyl-CoA synthetase (AMP-forming)/AMP-acid ligase II
VLYRHGNFTRQADEIRDFYRIQPGEIDLPGFPLFALFNCAMGVTTVLPDMDFTRPAQAKPQNIIEAVNDWQVTQAFGSPALLNVVGRYCEQQGIRLPTLRRVLSAGAPVPTHVLKRMKQAIHPEGDIHTPYGATEALPVASIAASTVLRETSQRSARGEGTCVGSRFPGIEWKVIAIDDGPLTSIDQVRELPPGQIGELIVSGPVVTREYVTRTDCNPLHKIEDGPRFWHRMGDVGYLETISESGRAGERFWFCGRKAHRVITATETLFTIPCEAIFNQHPRIYRSALVGVGPAGQQRPVIIAEPWPEHRTRDQTDAASLLAELQQLAQQHSHTRSITTFLLNNALPVDIRHNAKIFREKLAVWADQQLSAAKR